MDVAHALAAEGAPSGTVVVADEQTHGRGRSGAHWVSMPTRGLWCTLIERVDGAIVTDATSLCLGLIIAELLEPWHDGAVGVKWPNDVLLARGARWGKGAGVLVEARWRADRLDWLAVGIGINLDVPSAPVNDAVFAPVAPSRHPSRSVLVQALVPRVRAALQQGGPLTPDEHHAWSAHDVLRGARCIAPGDGVVEGVSALGALRVRVGDTGEVREYRAGSLRLLDEPRTP